MINRMLIDIRDILKSKGLSKTVELSVMPADCGIGDTDCVFGEPVAVTAELTSMNNGAVRAKGRLRVEYATFCARCLKPLQCAIDKPFDEQFAAQGTLGGEGDTYDLAGRELDMAPMLHDAILLELPIRHLCALGCKARCPACGKALADSPDGGTGVGLGAGSGEAVCDCGGKSPLGKFEALKGFFESEV
ncbi:MAG: YceD family protein [Clostridiales bacterium]|jgi:uncharacterized protein|nr:YceD family protein [Clostridiales bacterium]